MTLDEVVRLSNVYNVAQSDLDIRRGGCPQETRPPATQYQLFWRQGYLTPPYQLPVGFRTGCEPCPRGGIGKVNVEGSADFRARRVTRWAYSRRVGTAHSCSSMIYRERNPVSFAETAGLQFVGAHGMNHKLARV